MADDVAVTPGVGATIATDEVGSRHFQLIKPAFGAADEATLVDEATPLPAAPPKVATATVTGIADAAGSTLLASSNAARVGLLVFNDSGAALFLKYGTGASSSSFTVKLAPGDYWEMPQPIYTGVVHGAWASDAGGQALVTEL